LQYATTYAILLLKGVTMATLHVRSIPEDLYVQIQRLAETKSRSLSAQVVTMLTQALEDEKRRTVQVKTLASIHRRRFTAPKKTPSSLTLLREDRNR
jgi:plasmid stability protein